MRLRKVEIPYGDKKLLMYETEYKGKKFIGTLRECILLAWGFGCDQAAELRYEMAKLNREQNKKTADVSKQKEQHHVV